MYKDFKKSESLDTGFVGGSGIIWMFSGIVLGLLVGLGMYYFSNDRVPQISVLDSLEKKIQKAQSNPPVVTDATYVANKPATSKKIETPASAQKTPEQKEERRNKFSYYAVLPNLDVPVGSSKPIDTSTKALAQENSSENVDESAPAVEMTETAEVEETSENIGDYLLQVASFKKESMADKTRGRLSNKGIDAYVQKKKIKGRYWYRVVAGPVDQYSVDNWKNTAEKLGHKPLVISVR